MSYLLCYLVLVPALVSKKPTVKWDFPHPTHQERGKTTCEKLRVIRMIPVPPEFQYFWISIFPWNIYKNFLLFLYISNLNICLYLCTCMHLCLCLLFSIILYCSYVISLGFAHLTLPVSVFCVLQVAKVLHFFGCREFGVSPDYVQAFLLPLCTKIIPVGSEDHIECWE